MKHRFVFSLLATVLGLGMQASIATAVTIDTRQNTDYYLGYWSFVGDYNYGYDAIGSGSGTTREFYNTGQTFTVPTGDTVLTDFSFWLSAFSNYYNPGNVQFQAYLMPWDPATSLPSGVPLWASTVQPGTTDSTGISTYQADGANWVQYTFNTGGLTLTPGQMYGAVLSSVGTPSAGVGEYNLDTVQWRYPTYDPTTNQYSTGYTGGSLIYGFSVTNSTDPAVLADLTSDPTSPDYSYYYSGDPYNFYPQYDAAFLANFSPPTAPEPVPEPASLLLLGTGLVGVVGVARRYPKVAAD